MQMLLMRVTDAAKLKANHAITAPARTNFLDAIECVCDTKGKDNSDKPAMEVHQSNGPQNNQTNYTSTTIPAVSVDVELPVLEPSTMEAVIMIRFTFSGFSTEDFGDVDGEWRGYDAVASKQRYYDPEKFPSIGAQVVPIVHKAMKVRNKSQEEKLPVKVFWTVVSKTVMRSWDFFRWNLPIQNDTPFNFEVVDIDIKYPNSSPRKGSVRDSDQKT
ncbi:hypothetical protein BCR33DRAFT_784755 [Rhizoclosmatium globosum]|uniref:Uncharacterized protein n=1 Tax=Rhizoclosmatium globosum TaxID=329046 RepID=A0A1Y2CEC7_9FUNG|nr:hypothetical protein BCR33DRAFT_784755 [Rhizoclosmatium globosum]|eukprot:ORY45372.1 hypothetical protein BCR33DRAFT_784755 [Rhizoclosmatium globosum]